MADRTPVPTLDRARDPESVHIPDPTPVRVTYTELARARGISVPAARKLALRHRWPKQVGNDGLSHVLVPASFMGGNGGRDVPPVLAEAGAGMGVPPDLQIIVAPLQEAIGALRDELQHATERADRAERVAGVLRAKLAAARYAGEVVRAEVVNLRRCLDVATERLGEALAQVRALTDQRTAPPVSARRSWWRWGRRR